ncbi:hypothetical protein I6F26_33685 [Ensifer sp. IC3342]|nr:hypothetical protein [Ensifer sp. BRP08]MCA1451364.1 hypothetical protein [Ensifer sp. IC3342]
MTREINKRTVIDNTFCLAFADDRGLHPSVKDLARNAPMASNAATWQRSTVGRL